MPSTRDASWVPRSWSAGYSSFRRIERPAMTETISWIHFGDLHISNEGEQNHLDFLQLIGEANRYMRGDIAFGLLPGDNADDAEADQYDVVKRAVSICEFPVEAITGDHDKVGGSLALFEDCFPES